MEQEVVEKTYRTSLGASFFEWHRDLVHVFARIYENGKGRS
jgi:hypothetical protein